MDKHQLAQLTDLAQQHTDTATRTLGQSHARKREAEAQLALLKRYRGEYEERLASAARNGLTPEALRNYHEFLRKLDAAIEQQTSVLTACNDRIETSRVAWQSANRKLKSFDTLAVRAAVREQSERARREQREQDERAGRSVTHPSRLT